MTRDAHPATLLRRGRTITGMSAVLLPIEAGGRIDWPSFEALLERTVEAGLVPAVNMDTGYVQLLDEGERLAVLDATRAVAGESFVAGAHVADAPGEAWDRDATVRAMEPIETRGGLPVVFPSNGLTAFDGADWAGAHARLGETSDRFLAFELGPMFVPYGRIYDLDAYRALLDVPQCVGAKHSSLSRQLEWDRIALRDAHRPDFRVLTGNDLAIDMVMYGSDYLLGLSAFAPEAFAKRDALWEQDDPAFHEWNDLLQYLGFFAFRDPVPAYKHDAAIFLHLRGRIASPAPHPDAPGRPDGDREVLAEIVARLDALEGAP
jgi:dihydrodipicolinate synthase/N-acetylneuraminate lyase